MGVLRPRFVLLENVTGHLDVGFDRTLGDLAALGYDTEWDCLSAEAFGAPHERDRVYVVAYPHGGAELAVALDGAPSGLAAAEGARWPVWSPDAKTLGVDDGVSRGMDKRRLRALANAAVPQVVEWIGRRLPL